MRARWPPRPGAIVKKAETERQAFLAARDAIPAASMAGPQNSSAALLSVAAPVLDARIAEAKGDRAAAIVFWKNAVEAEDALAYDEPPAWYYPTRESLGAALLRDGRAAEAEAVFRADLDRTPAQRPLALRPVEEPRGPEEGRRRGLGPSAVRRGLEGAPTRRCGSRRL